MSHGRSTRRKARWGQNFLVNEGVVGRILEAAGELAGRGVLEVGPGHGALTRRLCDEGARVLALEIDPALAEELRAALPEGCAEIRLLDAVAAPWSELAGSLGGREPVPLVANLPYESGTAILGGWLEASARDARLQDAVVMLQREVAERIAAVPSTKAYGALSVLAQATHSVRTILDVSPGSFRPAPKVWSRVIHLRRRPDPLFDPAEREEVTALVHAAFSQRRKQLAVTLAGFRGLSREAWQELLAEAGTATTVRAEALSPAELVVLARRARSRGTSTAE